MSPTAFRDLTVFSHNDAVSAVRTFDMSCTDDDSNWTLSPNLSLFEPNSSLSEGCHNHIRAISNFHGSDSTCQCDVILDSGADTSVLPLRYSYVGESCPDPNTTFVDAQGCPLSVESSRVATLQFGNVSFRERFIIADVSAPLIALGHIIRSGWSLVQTDTGPCLVKGDKFVQVSYRNNSLCARGSISMVTEVEPSDSVQAIRVVQPGIMLRTLSAGWSRIGPHLFAIKTKLPKHVDTTAPSDELMWLRTTLVYRAGSGWEVDEFCEAISELPDGLEAELHFPDTVVEVITLARKYAMPAENLGFYMADFGIEPEKAAPPVNEPNADEDYEPSIHADPPQEAPVDLAEGEPLAEDRIVPADALEAVVHVDGVALTIDSTLKALKAGCA